MKNKVIRLTESDLEKLVKKIINEAEEIDPNDSSNNQPEENQDNPQDVKLFLDAMKKYFMQKYPKFASRINTKKEKAMLLAALANELQVDSSMINLAKSELKKLGM
jgi:hypothetical protein